MDPYYVTDLKSGYVWANDQTGVNLYYKFWTSLPSYYFPWDYEASGFQQFTASMQTAVQGIFSQISTFANITFTATTDNAQAQLGFAQASLPIGYDAWAYFPNGSSYAGDVWTSNLVSSTQNVSPGQYGYYVLLHEIGHALGLKHSFESPGLPDAEDNTHYTVMTYDTPVMPESYMLYDIAALQSLYGANMTYHTGNDTYTLQSGHVYTIWDAGGTDTINASALASAVTFNLNAGTFSSVGATNNIAIAFNVTIENAVGGSGNDTIYENDANNYIQAGSGNDSIFGGAGNDTLDGGAGTDTVIFSDALSNFAVTYVDEYTWTLHSNVGMGTDTLTRFENYSFAGQGYTQSDFLLFFGPAPGLNLYGTSGNDTLTGGTGNDNITDGQAGNGIPDGGNDTFYGGAGNDALGGMRGDDLLVGGAGKDLLNGGVGNDHLEGGDGDDILLGFLGNDVLLGGEGNDDITGGAGNNTLDGGTGNDYLLGGDNNDMIERGDGNDTIYAFGGVDTLLGGGGDDNIGSWGLINTISILTGGDGNDYVRGGNANDIINGDSGDDTLGGASGNDTISGGDGNDTVYGEAGNETMDGGLGTDTASFGPLSDYYIMFPDVGIVVVHSSQGDAILTGFEYYTFYVNTYSHAELEALPPSPNWTSDGTLSNDVFIGRFDDDQFHGYAGNDSISGNMGNDSLYGGDGNDSMSGNGGDDLLQGDGGNDILNGGAGNDTLLGGDGSDKLAGSDGDDSLAGGMANDKLDGGTGDDNLQGDAGSDSLGGGDGADTLYGGSGSDVLLGGLSDDILCGGAGKDKLTGGDGADIFLFDAATPVIASNADTILDFTAGDVVDIHALLSAYDPVTNLLSDFVDVTFTGRNTIIKVDADGALNGHLYITVATLLGVNFADENAMVAANALIVD